MSKKIVWGVVGIVVLVIVFYVGVSFGKNQAPASVAGGATSTYGGARGTRGGSFGGGLGGATFGQIISKDATSITVQLPTPAVGSTTSQSGSKIILLDPSTKITKQPSGTLSDLAVGTSVSVTGTANTDGSISATSVQIRPAVSGGNNAPMIPAQ